MHFFFPFFFNSAVFTFNNDLTYCLCLVLRLILMKLSTLSTLLYLSICRPADFWRTATVVISRHFPLCVKMLMCHFHTARVNWKNNYCFQTGCPNTAIGRPKLIQKYSNREIIRIKFFVPTNNLLTFSHLCIFSWNRKVL